MIGKEVDLVRCKHCNQESVRRFSHKASNKRSVFTDQYSRAWHGAKCPTCYRKYKLEYDDKRLRKLGHRKLGEYYKCIDCGKRELLTRGKTSRCPECTGKFLTESRGIHES